MNETAAVLQLISARHSLSKAVPAPPVLLTDGVLYRLFFFDESISKNSVILVKFITYNPGTFDNTIK